MLTPLLSGFLPIGSVSVTAGTHEVSVGAVTLAPGADTLWVKVTQQGGESPWPWGFGLASFVTAQGRELGTAKIYGNTDGEVFKLGNGLSPMERSGMLVFRPRSFSLAWLRAGNATWNLSFAARSGTAAAVSPPPVRFPVADQQQDRTWTLAWPQALARLNFR